MADVVYLLNWSCTLRKSERRLRGGDGGTDRPSTSGLDVMAKGMSESSTEANF